MNILGVNISECGKIPNNYIGPLGDIDGLHDLLRSKPPSNNQHVGIGPRSNYDLPGEVRSKAQCEVAGAILYPPNGYMGWHTNSDRPGRRIYAAWSQTGDSGMLWYRDGQVVVDKDEPGWNIRTFVTPCWHAVWSKCWRVSIGFWLKDELENLPPTA